MGGVNACRKKRVKKKKARKRKAKRKRKKKRKRARRNQKANMVKAKKSPQNPQKAPCLIPQ